MGDIPVECIQCDLGARETVDLAGAVTLLGADAALEYDAADCVGSGRLHQCLCGQGIVREGVG